MDRLADEAEIEWLVQTSTHSVEPMSPYSSAPQLQNTIVRLGRQPQQQIHNQTPLLHVTHRFTR